jgi:hypothetical protein
MRTFTSLSVRTLRRTDLAPTEHALALEMAKLQADAPRLFKSYLTRNKRVDAHGVWDLRG